MRKSFTIFMALVIAFFTVPFGGITALADEKVYDDIEDGEYGIKAYAKKEGTNEASTAADYMSDEAMLIVESGQVKLKLFIPDNPAMIFSKLEVAGAEPSEEKGELDGENGKFYTYKISKLQPILSAVTTYEVPMFNLVHENVGLDFHLEGLDDLPVKEELEEDPEKPGDDENSDNSEGESDNGNESEDGNEEEDGSNGLGNEAEDKEDKEETLITNADRAYKVEYVTDTPMIENYFDNPVTLLYKDGKKYIQMDGNSGGLIDSLTIDGEEVTWGEMKKDDTYTVQFEINSLSEELDFGMVIDTGNPQYGKMEHTVKLWFEEIEEEKPKEDPKEEPKEEPKDPVEVDEKSKLKPDKAYKIDYVIKQEDGIQDSVANNFFTGKATLLLKDGKTYVQMTITNGDMIKKLSNKHGDALLIHENKDGSIVVQLRVDNDLSDMELDMHIHVPEGAIPNFPGYNEEHKALLVFDKASKEGIDVGGHLLVGSSESNNQSGPYIDAGGTPPLGVEEGDENGELDDGVEKPTFGNGDNDKNGEEVVKSGKTDNPKTGDTTSMILYSLLLIGSLIPLAAKFRRRFI